MESNNTIVDPVEKNKMFNNKPNKYVDNRINTSKGKINEIDEKLDNEKQKIKKLSDMQDTVNSIAKRMNRCIDLLSKSISGGGVNNRFSDMRNSNKLFLRKATASIEEESMVVRKRINELYKEKDIVLRDNRANYYKQLNEEKKNINDDNIKDSEKVVEQLKEIKENEDKKEE